MKRPTRIERVQHVVRECLEPPRGPELVVHARRSERGVGVAGFPPLGVPLRVVDGEGADGVRTIQRDRPPVLDVESEARHAAERLLALHEIFPAFVRLARVDARAPDRRSEIQQVMTHDLLAVLLDDGIERVDGFRVDVVQPRRERPVATQFATMLVRDDIVGIVGPRAVEPEAADRPPLERLAGDDAVRSIGLAVRPAQQQPDIRFLEATPFAARRCDAGLIVDRQFLGPQRRQVRLRHVISQPPEQPGDDDLRAGRHGGIAWRIELDEPDLPCGIAHGEPRHHAIVLGRNHRPAARRRTVAGPRAL